MIKLEKCSIYGFEAAVRGMRNPLNSWVLSDSVFDEPETVELGPKDLGLLRRLHAAGPDHAKALRFITVTVDITAPWYWWKEFDTYKVGTVANSCSTMHKLMAKEFTLADFSLDHLQKVMRPWAIEDIIKDLNRLRDAYLDFDTDQRVKKTAEEKGLTRKDIWYALVELLPSSYLQRRTVQMNYQVLASMVKARSAHKLDEWREFCSWAKTLPYFVDICGEA